MKHSLIRVLFALAVGLTLIMWPDEATHYLVIATGVLFILPSVVSFLVYIFSKNRRFPFDGIGSLLLGVWLVAMPELFAYLLMYILGGIDNRRRATDCVIVHRKTMDASVAILLYHAPADTCGWSNCGVQSRKHTQFHFSHHWRCLPYIRRI